MATGDEREYAKNISKHLSKKEHSIVIEGSEGADFWTAIGGETE